MTPPNTPPNRTSLPGDQPDPPHGKRSKSHHTLATVDRDAEAARMRAQGFSYRQIGAALHISHQSAMDAVTRCLMMVPTENVTQLRKIENEGIGADMQALQAIVDNPPYIVAANGRTTDQVNADAVTRAIDARTRLRARSARLNGLDSPQVRVNVSATRLEQEIRRMARELGIDTDPDNAVAGEVLGDE